MLAQRAALNGLKHAHHLRSLQNRLSSQISGHVYHRSDKEYLKELEGFNSGIKHRPDLVVAAKSRKDIVESVKLAREFGCHVNVHSTGHGTYTPIKSGIMISTRYLNEFEIDADNGIATIGAGVQWKSIIESAAKVGLAPIAGSSPTVNVMGYILGGGLGPLARSHGFSSDYLESATVITGNGEVVEANRNQNADLFWALQGGKTGLGIVTDIKLRLVRLQKIYGGSLFFEEKDIDKAFRSWIDWTAKADPNVTTSAAIVKFPPIDALPPPLRGRKLMTLRFAYPGSVEEGGRLAAPLRQFAPVYLDMLGELDMRNIAKIHNDPINPSPFWGSGVLLKNIDTSCVDTLLDQINNDKNSPFVAAEIRHLGNATRRDVENRSAVGGRSAGFVLSVIGKNPAFFDTVFPQAMEKIITLINPWVADENNINFIGKPLNLAHFSSCWSNQTSKKLAEIRQKYDPCGIYSHSIYEEGLSPQADVIDDEIASSQAKKSRLDNTSQNEDIAKARDFYAKGKFSFKNNNFANALTLFDSAKVHYAKSLSSSELNNADKVEISKRLVKLSENGRYSPASLKK